MEMPPIRAVHSPLGKAFSISTSTASDATQKRFMTPIANSNNIIIQQQPTQSRPCSNPISNPPVLPGLQLFRMKFNGDRHPFKHARFRGVIW